MPVVSLLPAPFSQLFVEGSCSHLCVPSSLLSFSVFVSVSLPLSVSVPQTVSASVSEVCLCPVGLCFSAVLLPGVSVFYRYFCLFVLACLLLLLCVFCLLMYSLACTTFFLAFFSCASSCVLLAKEPFLPSPVSLLAFRLHCRLFPHGVPVCMCARDVRGAPCCLLTASVLCCGVWGGVGLCPACLPCGCRS